MTRKYQTYSLNMRRGGPSRAVAVLCTVTGQVVPVGGRLNLARLNQHGQEVSVLSANCDERVISGLRHVAQEYERVGLKPPIFMGGDGQLYRLS